MFGKSVLARVGFVGFGPQVSVCFREGRVCRVQAQTIFMGRFPLGLAQAQGGAQPGVRALSYPTTQGPDVENLNLARR